MVDHRCSLVLSNQGKICINGKEYLIEKEIGRGASCICYTATSCENGLNYIIKEFYPLTCAKRTVDMKIVAKDGAADEFLQCKKRFEKLYENNLTIQKTHKNLFVEPNYELSGNGYIVMPARDLCTLSEWVADNIPQDSANNTVIDGYLNNALNILHSIAEQLEIYQKNNIIHFDIKPDNIFVFQENNGYFARIIDFDSMMTFSEIEELLDKNQSLKLYSTANCYGLEIRHCDTLLKDGFSEKWKQIDVYPLGKLFAFILTGNKSLDFGLVVDSCFLTANKSETVNIRKYVFDRFIDKLTSGFGNRYSDAVTVKFVIENLQAFMLCYGYFDNQLKYRKDIVPDLLCNKVVYETNGTLSPLENLIKCENVFENKQSLLLLAECGMGKSTALRKLYLDAILFNQSKYRFVYYSLRECSSEKQAKNLEKDVFAPNLIDKNNAVVLLDAFDESEGNDGGDCREELVARINDICEKNSVILTSRIDVKGMQAAKKVTCKPKDFSDSELLKRIQENSPWVKSLHGDILANPLYVIMAESVSLIDDYVREEKEIGKTCWSLIKEQLLGSVEPNGQLKINYAGELIWNYVYISILSSFKTKNEVLNIIGILRDLSVPEKQQEYMNHTSLRESQLFLVDGKEGFIGSNMATSMFLKGAKQEDDNYVAMMLSYRQAFLYTSALRYIHCNTWNCTELDLPFSEDREYLSEICGCKYPDLKSISTLQRSRRENLKQFIEELKNDTSSSLIDKTNALLLLFWESSEINGFDFSGLDLSLIKVFQTVKNCKFDHCKLFINSGRFENCSFADLQEGSFISPDIMGGYCYCEDNNILTKDKKILVMVKNFDESSCFAKLSAKTIQQIEIVPINAFSPIKPSRIVIPDNVIRIHGYKGEFVADTIIVSGNTIIDNLCEEGFNNKDYSERFVELEYLNLLELINNICVNKSEKYFEDNGCVYAKKSDESACDYQFLLWINQFKKIHFLPQIMVDNMDRIVCKRRHNNVWEHIILPQSIILGKKRINYKNDIPVRFLTCLLRNSKNVKTVTGLSANYAIVCGFLIHGDRIIYDFNVEKALLYLPSQVLLCCGSVINFYYRIYIPVNEMDLYNPCVKITQEYLDQSSHDENFTQELNKSYIRNQLKTKLVTWEELSDTQKEDILRQQKEWDKYLNN